MKVVFNIAYLTGYDYDTNPAEWPFEAYPVLGDVIDEATIIKVFGSIPMDKEPEERFTRPQFKVWSRYFDTRNEVSYLWIELREYEG